MNHLCEATHCLNRWIWWRHHCNVDTIEAVSGSESKRVAGREHWGLLLMTKEQLLNQPSLSMLISSILALMNWLVCERTGVIILIGEGDRSEAGGEEVGATPELDGWKGGMRACALACLWSVSGAPFVTIEQSPGPVRHNADHSMLGCQTQATVLWSLYFLHFREKFVYWQKVKDRGERGRKREKNRYRGREVLSWRSN